MPGDLPKVAHRVADRPMVAWVVDAVRALDADPIVLVVGYKQQVIRSLFEQETGLRYAVQTDQLGTAHAVESARGAMQGFEGDVFVLAGDGPLIRSETLRALLDRHRSTGAAATLATSVIDDPTGYGRIVRDASGGFQQIVEHKNATPEQRAIREVNPSYYCFDCRLLFAALPRVNRDGVSGEYYLTDVPALLKQDGHRVEVIDAVPAADVLSINTEPQRQEVERILQQRQEVSR